MISNRYFPGSSKFGGRSLTLLKRSWMTPCRPKNMSTKPREQTRVSVTSESKNTHWYSYQYLQKIHWYSRWIYQTYHLCVFKVSAGVFSTGAARFHFLCQRCMRAFEDALKDLFLWLPCLLHSMQTTLGLFSSSPHLQPISSFSPHCPTHILLF